MPGTICGSIRISSFVLPAYPEFQGSASITSLQSARDGFAFGSIPSGLNALAKFQTVVQQLISTNADAILNRENTLFADVSDIQGCKNDLVFAGRATPALQFNATPKTVNTGLIVNLTATVTAPQGNSNIPSGLVQFSGGDGMNNVALGSGTLDGSGNITLSTTQLPVGDDILVASY